MKVNLDQLVLGWSSFKFVSVDSQLSKMAATADYATFGFQEVWFN